MVVILAKFYISIHLDVSIQTPNDRLSATDDRCGSPRSARALGAAAGPGSLSRGRPPERRLRPGRQGQWPARPRQLPGGQRGRRRRRRGPCPRRAGWRAPPREQGAGPARPPAERARSTWPPALSSGQPSCPPPAPAASARAAPPARRGPPRGPRGAARPVRSTWPERPAPAFSARASLAARGPRAAAGHADSPGFGARARPRLDRRAPHERGDP